jgi:hypothetical protein
MSPDSARSSEISFAKTNDFLDFVEMKSNSNSWRMTIHLLIFPPIIHCVNMYWNGFTTAMMVVLRNKEHSDGIVEQHDMLPTQVFRYVNN